MQKRLTEQLGIIFYKLYFIDEKTEGQKVDLPKVLLL